MRRQEHSIPAQRQELLRYAEKHNYHVLREYLDEAISGDDTRRRVGFLRMREDAQQGEFSVVLCWDQDRFGRFDPIEGGHWILPFRDAGVRLETIAQGKIDWNDFAGRLIYLVQQEGKHAYLRDLSRNVTRGFLNAAKNGRGGTGGRAPGRLQATTTGKSWSIPSGRPWSAVSTTNTSSRPQVSAPSPISSTAKASLRTGATSGPALPFGTYCRTANTREPLSASRTGSASTMRSRMARLSNGGRPIARRNRNR